MKIYTATGDRGKTSLFSGERVSKASERIEAYGDLDELNSTIGALITHLPSDRSDLSGELQQIQADIFMISDVTLLVDELFEGSFIYTETFY